MSIPVRRSGRSDGLLLALAAGAAFAAVLAAGYFGFRLFAGGALAAANLYLLAVAAGVASFFSPCAFPLLPAYFSFFYRATAEGAGPERSQASGSALQLGLAAALGVIVFDLLLGLLIALLGTALAGGLGISGPQPNPGVRLFRGGVGLILLILGAGQLLGWNLKLPVVDWLAFRTRPQRANPHGPARSLFLYGLGYNAAGMGCTGPILAGLIVAALSAGGFAPALIAFGIFSATMGLLMLLVSALVAASHEGLLRQLKTATPRIKSTASLLLILVGLFNIYTTINLDLFVRVLFS